MIPMSFAEEKKSKCLSQQHTKTWLDQNPQVLQNEKDEIEMKLTSKRKIGNDKTVPATFISAET
jgi:hypothetical protein